MNVYMFQAELFCEKCGEAIRERLDAENAYNAADYEKQYGKPYDPPNANTPETEYDSGEYPKGPIADAGGESDSIQHCASGSECLEPTIIAGEKYGKFLENDLTKDGVKHLNELIKDDPASPVVNFWAEFYDKNYDIETPDALAIKRVIENIAKKENKSFEQVKKEVFAFLDNPSSEITMSARVQLLTKDEAVKQGFASFNSQQHIAIDLPDGGSTITVKTKDGRRVTFAFQPYEENGIPKVCDIQFHDSGKTILNGDKKVPIQEAVVYTPGLPIHVSKLTDAKPCTLICLSLLHHK